MSTVDHTCAAPEDGANLASNQTSGRTDPRRKLGWRDPGGSGRGDRQNWEERRRAATLNLVLHVSTAQQQPQPQPTAAATRDAPVTSGDLKLNVMVTKDELLFFVINVNYHATESEFDNVYGCRHSLNDGVMRVSDATTGRKCELVYGHGDVGNG